MVSRSYVIPFVHCITASFDVICSFCGTDMKYNVTLIQFAFPRLYVKSAKKKVSIHKSNIVWD